MQRITEVTRDCFNALVWFRSLDANSVGDPRHHYQRLCGFVDQMLADARAAGYDELDVVDITYAIVALADETALRGGGAIRELWMQRPLQLHYFNENLAGEGFFNRLEAVMADPARAEILRVYYACLAFGFQGKYAVRGGELELEATFNRVKQALARELADLPLSVQPLRPREDLGRGVGFPAVWIALLCLLFSLGMLIVLRVGLDGRTEGLVERMRPLAAIEAGERGRP